MMTSPEEYRMFARSIVERRSFSDTCRNTPQVEKQKKRCNDRCNSRVSCHGVKVLLQNEQGAPPVPIECPVSEPDDNSRPGSYRKDGIVSGVPSPS